MTTALHEKSDRDAVAAGCTFDADAADAAVRWIESEVVLHLGRWGGLPLQLLPWQSGLVRRIFGWKRLDGGSRYRAVHLSTAKKNGSTTLLLAIAAALARMGSTPPPAVRLQAACGGAAGLLQSRVLSMYRNSPGLRSTVEFDARKRRVRDRISGGSLQVLATRVDALDGRDDSAAVVDDLHRLCDLRLWETTWPGNGVRFEGLCVSASGAGVGPGPWLVERHYARKVSAGEIDDVGYLGVVFEAEAGDDPASPETWRKANPSLGTIVSEDYLRGEYEHARRTHGMLAHFERLHLNQVA